MKRKTGWRSLAPTAHRMAGIEGLERRCLLTSVTETIPLEGSHTASLDTSISAHYDTPLDPASITNNTFAIHGSQSGRQTVPQPELSPEGDELTLQPSPPWHAGELVEVTATSGIQSLAGESAASYVWQFRSVPLIEC